MILAINVYDINKSNVIISNKEKNLVCDYKYFYKLFYSTSYYVMNGIFIKINFTDYKIHNFYNYIKLNYKVERNISLINSIYHIETSILSDVAPNIKNNLYNELLQGTIKIQKKKITNTPYEVTLKITGIWENNNICGLCYKFILQ